MNRCSKLNRFFSQVKDSNHNQNNQNITIQWILKNGDIVKTPGLIGSTLLEIAHKHNIPVEGACEGVCACSTCHVILERNIYENLPEPSEKEEDMLDQAFGLTPTSRLGCQVKVTAEHDSIKVKLPKATRNFYVVRECSNGY